MPYLPHVPAHAEPSAAAYHVHCPACGSWVAGAVARAIGLELWALTCPRCGSGAPGRISLDCVLPFGPYSGRAVSSLRTDAGRDYLDYLLHTQGLPAGLRLAILWHLGWLSPERAHVAAGPNLGRLRRGWDQFQHQQDRAASRAASRAATDEKANKTAQAWAERHASWVRQLNAEQERQRAGRPRRPQQFHQYQRPAEPLPPLETQGPIGDETPQPSPEWAAVLGVGWPATAQQIRRAYLRLSKRHHPDVGGSLVGMQKINGAYNEAEAWLRTAP